MPGSKPAYKTADNRWVIPDDGIIDPVGVEVAVSGHRPMRPAAASARAPWQSAYVRHG
jgi:hypothetical protein